MLLPNYILRQMSCAGGVRLPKSAPRMVVGPRRGIYSYQDSEWLDGVSHPLARYCESCGLHVGCITIGSFRKLDGVKTGDVYWHTECLANKPGSFRIKQGEEKVLRGNLPQEEYRIWIGNRTIGPMNYVGWSMCRCCRHVSWEPKERMLHINDEAMAVAGERCAGRLAKAYKILLARITHCIVCRKNRYNHAKWGVPICNSASCENEWKFGQDEYILLKSELSKQERTAKLLVAHKKVEANPDAMYCDMCQMFKADRRHATSHADFEQMFRDIQND